MPLTNQQPVLESGSMSRLPTYGLSDRTPAVLRGKQSGESVQKASTFGLSRRSTAKIAPSPHRSTRAWPAQRQSSGGHLNRFSIRLV